MGLEAVGEEEEGLEDLVQLALAEGKEVRFLRTISIYSGTLRNEDTSLTKKPYICPKNSSCMQFSPTPETRTPR